MGPGLTADPSRGIVREIRRQSEPLRAQHLWDAIRAVRLQKQIPAIPRMGRYMHRYHGLTNEATQRLLDLAVEDNLIKVRIDHTGIISVPVSIRNLNKRSTLKQKVVCYLNKK